MPSRQITYILLIAAMLSSRLAVAQESVTAGISGNLTVTNCVVDNEINFDQLSPSVNINYSIIRGAVVPAGNLVLSDGTLISDIIAAPSSGDSYYLAVLSPLVNSGNPTAPVVLPDKDINGNIRNYNGRTDIGSVEYSMIFDKMNGNWNTADNWNIGRLPDENDIVTISKETIVNDNNARCHSIISIGNTGKITIDPSAQLVVESAINNINAQKIIIKASPESSNGTFIFHNPANNPVYATVQMYSQANLYSTETDTTYRWQYFGIPLRSIVASPVLNGSWARQWNESSTEYSKWEQLNNLSVLSSFSGYEITQNTAKYINFEGVLENRDTTLVLNKSSVPYYAGQHVLANPYTAAINISDLVFGNNTEATVYIYNTGSYDDWNSDNSNGRIGDGNGQYTAVPQNTAYLIYPSIPSMQGFVVRATDNPGSLTIPYSSNSQNIIKQKVKGNFTRNGLLSIRLSSDHYTDCVWLLHEPTASRGYDNGWDGYKLISNNSDAIIYAKEAAGDFQVNTLCDFNNISLHFKAGKDTQYKLTIINHELSKEYSEIFLIDIKENKVITIEEDTTVYTFSAHNSNKEENRFRIMTGKSFEFNPTVDNAISIYQNYEEKEISLYNTTERTGNFLISDMSGRLLLSGQLMPGLNTVSTENYSGIIIIKAVAEKSSTTMKMIVN